MLSAIELETRLGDFWGTEEKFRFSPVFPKVLLTDGAKYVADNADAYWLMDVIASHIPAMKGDWFASAKLTVNSHFVTGPIAEDHKATFTLDDGNGHILATQEIEYTDFPLSTINFFVEYDEENWTILLPGEH